MKKIIILIFFSLVGVFLFNFTKRVFSIVKPSSHKAHNYLISDCNLQKQSCDLSLRSIEGIIELSPKPFSLDQKIEIKISMSQKITHDLYIDLQGTTMDMGLNRFKLRTEDQQNFFLKLKLPTCVKQFMTWRLRVLEQTEENGPIPEFNFVAYQKE